MKIPSSILLLVLSSLGSFLAAFIGFGQVPDGYSLSTRVYLALQLSSPPEEDAKKTKEEEF
jgi:hypothetical protein